MSNNTDESAKSSAPRAALAGKYLTFSFCGEYYALPIMKVKEIINRADTTIVPQLPLYIKGVISQRGKTIPIIDLRAKFNLAVANKTQQTCLVITRLIAASPAPVFMGLMVDAVEEVTQIDAQDIEEAPEVGTGICSAYITGLARKNDKEIFLLDIDLALGQAEIEAANAILSADDQ